MSLKKVSITMNDVANQAGVSLKTVSNVVNEWPYVSEDTRDKVLKAIKETGYRRNNNARSLVTGKTRTIGVIVPDVSNPFFGLAIRGCEGLLFDAEYSIFLCNSNEDVEREVFYLNLLMSQGVDGVILWGAKVSCAELMKIIPENIAIVTEDVSGEPQRKNHINISIDSLGGANQAVEHLIERGNRKIAHFQGPKNRPTSLRRFQGYRQALESNGISFDRDLVFSELPSISGGFRAASKLLATTSVDAIFCYNDLMALGVLVAARKISLRVPDDLAVVGFDDISMASLVSPPLSTVKIDQYALGKRAAELVLNILDGKTVDFGTVTFPVELRIRASSMKQEFSDQEEELLNELIRTLSNEYPFT